ncbi:MAG TPA: DUF5926 family protein [Nocardioides sp.]|uniref:DUF5926 family protein n=1 Tax=Nocardioides sp. TaxID=35761 RepID=UPI002F42EC62
MAKKSRTKARDRATEGGVGPREPCPCGSGKRYKACHGSTGGVFVSRPFAGLAAERDLVALREFVPSATAPLTVGDRTVLLGSLLPMAAPAMVRDSGEVWLAMQVRHAFGDPSRDLGAVLEKAIAADEAGIVGLVDPPGPGARLQDLVADEPIEVTVHDGFEWWLGDVEERDQAMADALEQANGAVAPTARLSSVEAAYWVDAGSKEHLRWVLPQDENALLDALARLHAAGEDSIADGSKLVGMFRAHGLLTPVWDLPPGTGAAVLEEPVAAFEGRLVEALDAGGDLCAEERAARSMLANHQVTLR